MARILSTASTFAAVFSSNLARKHVIWAIRCMDVFHCGREELCMFEVQIKISSNRTQHPSIAPCPLNTDKQLTSPLLNFCSPLRGSLILGPLIHRAFGVADDLQVAFMNDGTAHVIVQLHLRRRRGSGKA